MALVALFLFWGGGGWLADRAGPVPTMVGDKVACVGVSLIWDAEAVGDYK